MAEVISIDVGAYKQFERDGYSKVADAYDRATAAVTAQINGAILDAAGVARGTTVLDVACGPGWLSSDAMARGAIVTGIDFAPRMVAVARARNPRGKFREGDAEDLPFSDNQFDVVICNLGFPHFANPERAMAEAFRVLVPGGRFALTNWTPPERNPFMRLIFGSVRTHGTLDVELPSGPPVFRFGDPDECGRVLVAFGFRAVTMAELPMVWPFASADAIVASVIASTARMGPLLAAQTPGQRAAIEAAVAAEASAYSSDGGVAIPTSVVLARGEKP